uniref:F-box domain-containing protein n=1 Tax=Leersia perrieri TaxID=77586 RepID=A0A0D9XLP2_9ORYZ
MGAGVSSLFGLDGGEGESSAAAVAAGAGLGDLPELCAAQVLLRLDAPEICRLARLNHAFRGAAGADFVWEAKLPENYRYLMSFVDGCGGGGGDDGRRVRRRRRPAGKKEIYARLSRPVPFDGGSKEFWLEKSKGRVCMALSSKSLVITGIDDRRYWQHIPTAESRFQSVAYLQQIWWFEVVGEMDFCFPVGTYSLYFRVHLGKFYKRFGRRVCSTEHVHGWDKKPVRFQLSTSDGQHSLSQCSLGEPGSWLLYHAGDFVASKPDQTIKLKFSMAQIDCTHTKGGLCVDSVLIYPKGFQQERMVRSQKCRC